MVCSSTTQRGQPQFRRMVVHRTGSPIRRTTRVPGLSIHPAGTDFVHGVLHGIRSAHIVLAVIGSCWLTITGPAGRRQIDDPDDRIRRELVEAFHFGIRVIPVLTDEDRMPT